MSLYFDNKVDALLAPQPGRPGNPSAVHLHHTSPAHALTEVFVRGQQPHLVHAAIFARDSHGRCQRVISLEFSHRPHSDAHFT